MTTSLKLWQGYFKILIKDELREKKIKFLIEQSIKLILTKNKSSVSQKQMSTNKSRSSIEWKQIRNILIKRDYFKQLISTITGGNQTNKIVPRILLIN
ncbi:hypothetical protein ACFFSY_29350 [Paenibacillus aurantiacus]|uniref:Reverse transcriptase N-terminal domain-containing protein n=1 Tax=Paenibacillus aurantiacus TaxID=1936118 RepID=A0ABV5KXX5_9BACL